MVVEHVVDLGPGTVVAFLDEENAVFVEDGSADIYFRAA